MCYNVQDMDARTLGFIREKAAGSACSLLVLETVGILGRAELAKQETTRLGDTLNGPDQKIGYRPFAEPVPLGDGELVVVDSKSEEDSCIGYLNPLKTKVLPLWQIVEHDNDFTDTESTVNQCSQALFLPASRDGLELDFTLVVTKVDESSPRLSAENLNPKPVTNAAVLRELNNCLQRRPNNLAQLIQLDELSKVYQLDPLAQPSRIGQTSEPRDALVRRMMRIIKLIDRLPSGIFDDGLLHTATVEGDSSVVARAKLLPLGRLAVSVLCANLGKSGRIAPMKDLQLIDEQLILPEEPETSDVTSTLSYEVATVALEVPEIYVNQEFKDKLQLVVSRQKNLDGVSQEVGEMISALRQENGLSPQVIIDLGIIDVGHIQRPGEPGSKNASLELFNVMNRVKAKVFARGWMNVFSSASNLYECSVDGANGAFFKAKGLSCCDVTNSNSAFFNAQATDCSASNTDSAFAFADANRCLAESCESAFSNDRFVDAPFKTTNSIAIDSRSAFQKATATGCYARDCKTAFEGAKAEDNTAENCRYAFYQTYGGHKNTVINPQQRWRPHKAPLTYGLLRGNKIVRRKK